MSNSIFPMPVLPGGSRGWPIGKYPVFSTLVQTPASFSGETRISKTPLCRWQFDMTFPMLKGTFNDPTSYLAKVMGFYMQMGGQAASWLYDDPYDNTIASSAPATFGTGDGLTTQFRLSRPIGGYLDIIQNLNGAASIYIAGALQSTGYSIDALGVVTFNSAPAINAVLAWSGKYFFRCRFLKDMTDQLKMIAPNFFNLTQLEWISVIS
jgi:hypothetical protein